MLDLDMIFFESSTFIKVQQVHTVLKRPRLYFFLEVDYVNLIFDNFVIWSHHPPFGFFDELRKT